MLASIGNLPILMAVRYKLEAPGVLNFGAVKLFKTNERD
jgi:hypothetical protein